ncbi:MAG: hypothetical protein CMK43_06415 [Porticoccaceae bacterium]|nr:hypothetical protein [Porticoccaceae bacterium]|tara:strand:- start:668 stop:865 length:198 start_codon:yes stop_codon:yes gene_type:complete
MKRLILFLAIVQPAIAEQLLAAKEQKKLTDLLADLFELPALVDVLLATTRGEVIVGAPFSILFEN